MSVEKNFDEYLSSSVLFTIRKESIMNINNQLLPYISFLTLTTKALQINKTEINYLARLYIYIAITVVLLLMTGNASSARIDAIKADMQLNEAPLLNVAETDPRTWLKRGTITMGGAPRGDATPTWWKPANLTYKSSLSWNAITPWFVISPGVDNAAKNVRVKVYGITLHVLDKSTNEWKRFDTGSFGNPTWARNQDYSGGGTKFFGNADSRTEPDGAISYKLNSDSNAIHGGSRKIDMKKYIEPKNVAAVFIQLKTQLILDNPAGVDDRASAQILINVAADYYPEMTSGISDFSPMGYAPAVGTSRFGLVKMEPRNHYMTTIDPPGTPKANSEYLLKGGEVVIPADQFEANMPEYLFDTTAPSAPTSLKLIFNKPTTTSWASNSLSWNKSTDDVVVAGYNIYRDGKKIGASTSNNYKDSFPTAGTGALYSYTVKAFDDAGNLSTSSNKVLTVY